MSEHLGTEASGEGIQGPLLMLANAQVESRSGETGKRIEEAKPETLLRE